MEKMIMIPEWRYNKMVESYNRAMDELKDIRLQLLQVEEERRNGSKD